MYSLQDALIVIPKRDEPFLIAYMNLLSSYGWQEDMQTTYLLLSNDYESFINWQSGNNIEGLTLKQDSDAGGWPISDPSIVVFLVDGQPLPCFAVDVEQSLIIDTTDGQQKTNPYGKPIAWATFEEPRFRSLVPEPKQVPMIYKDNTVDGIHIRSYGTPKRMYVKNPVGAPLMNFGGQIDTFRDFRPVPGDILAYGTEVRIMGVAHHPVQPNGIDFLMPMDPFNAWGEFTRTGRPTMFAGYKLGDLSDTSPPKRPAIDRDVVSQVARLKVKGPDLGQPLRDTFKYLRDDQEPVPYQVMRKFGSYSYLKPGAETIVIQPGTLGNPRIIRILGRFWVDGEPYLLPLLDGGADPFDWFYGVIEEINGKRIVEKLPDSTDVPDDGILTDEEQRVVRQRPSALDYFDSISSLIEVTAIRGVLKLKRHVERIKTWKQ